MILDRQNKLVIYDGAEAARLHELLPKAPRINGWTLVPTRVDVLQWLRKHDFPIPALIANHSWPGDYPKPFKAQHITANFLLATPRAFVLSDMGTGKTLAALIAADYLMEQSNDRFRCLIVAPLSTLSSVWGQAIFRTFLSRRSYKILHGSAEKRRAELAAPADFYIINPDGLGIGFPAERRAALAGLAADIAARDDIKLVIVDEASCYRDIQTHRHRVARRLISARPYFWLMTGTPASNAPTDAYGLAKLVNNAWGESFRSFRERTMMRLDQGWTSPFAKLVPRTGAKEMVRQLLQPAVRFSIADCQDLPPCTVQRRDVELTPAQAKAMKELRRDAQVSLGAGKLISAVNEAALRTKLIQIACGAVYDASHAAHEIDAGPRLAAVEEIVEQTERKIIVFAPLTSALNLLKVKLSRFGCAVVNGDTTLKERKETFDQFGGIDTAHPIKVIAADPGTMAHGLNLTAASVIVWYAPTDRTELYIQANKRIDRPGQTVPTTIVQIAATATEREIYRRLEANENMQGAILKLIEGGE
jgi:SNF2 family DNA or RNA helicase